MQASSMEKLSLGLGEAPVTPIDAAGGSLRCPSCDHANPAGSHYCNQCGMPVHFEACGRCEAINHRGAASCHKCGCSLPGSAIPESAATAPAVVDPMPSRPAGLVDSNAGSPPDVAAPAQRRRHTALRAALISLGLALVAVPTYIATEHPGTFDRVVDAIAPRGNVAADSPAPTAGPTPLPPSETADALPAPAAATHDAARATPQNGSAPSPEIARDVESSNAAPSASVPPPVAQGARSTASKSKSSRAGQSKSSRKPPARKPAAKSS